nr:GLPGLI family protein [Flavobacterium cyanobacteriorum]
MSTLFDGVRNYDALLTLSDSESCFEYKLFEKDTITTESEDEKGNRFISVPNKRKQLIFTSLISKTIKELKYFKDTFLVVDTLITPKWDIKDETRIIGGLKCQKATTFFKGRDYVVWFTTEITTFFGPWKLNGLPGLIVLANDKRNEVYFEITEVLKNNASICQVDTSIKNISKVQFDKKIKEWQNDFEETLKSKGDRNLKFNVKFGKSTDIEIIN